MEASQRWTGRYIQKCLLTYPSLGQLSSKWRHFSTAPWVQDTLEEYFTFPRESERNNYAVNWSLAKIGVPPKGEVFYNVPSRTIVANSPGKLSRERRHLLVPHQKTGNFQEFVLGNNLKPREYAKALKAVTNSLSRSDQLFVTDGAFGSHPQAEIRIRTVTDSPLVALFLHHFLEPIPSRSSPLSSSLSLESQSPLVVGYIHTNHMATSGIFSSPCCLLAMDRGQFVMDGGPLGNDGRWYPLLLSSLAQMASPLLFETREAFLLKSVVKNGRLILGRFENQVHTSVDPACSDYGYYHHILSSRGCSRAWKGYIVSASNETTAATSFKNQERYSVEYALSDGKFTCQSLLPRPPNVVSLPRYCVIVNWHQNKGPLEVYSLSDNDAAALAFLIASESLVSKVSQLRSYAQSLLSFLRQHRIPLYLVSGEGALQQASAMDFAKDAKVQPISSKMVNAAKKYAQQVYGSDILELEEENKS